MHVCFHVGNIVYLIYIFGSIQMNAKKNKQSMGDTPKMKIDRWDILWIFLFFYFFFENTDNIDDDDKFRICNIIQLLSSLMSYIYVYDVYGWFNRIKKIFLLSLLLLLCSWLIDWLIDVMIMINHRHHWEYCNRSMKKINNGYNVKLSTLKVVEK